MELHRGKANGLKRPGEIGLGELWLESLRYVQGDPELRAYYKRLEGLRPGSIKAEDFWAEYVWVVYVPGLSAHVVAQLWPRLLPAVGAWHEREAIGPLLKRLEGINRNFAKADAVTKCRDMLHAWGWSNFRDGFLKKVDSMEALPMVGKVTKYHLARNLGHDVVKPDIHLERLARAYGYESPLALCRQISEDLGIRIGCVDLALWAYCAAAGTEHLRERTE